MGLRPGPCPGWPASSQTRCPPPPPPRPRSLRIPGTRAARLGSRTLEYIDVPHSRQKCNFSAGTIMVNYSPVFGAWQRFSVIVLLVLCCAVHLGSTENINKRPPGAPSSYYFCQNEILYNERVNGLLSKFFIYFTDICPLYLL